MKIIWLYIIVPQNDNKPTSVRWCSKKMVKYLNKEGECSSANVISQFYLRYGLLILLHMHMWIKVQSAAAPGMIADATGMQTKGATCLCRLAEDRSQEDRSGLEWTSEYWALSTILLASTGESENTCNELPEISSSESSGMDNANNNNARFLEIVLKSLPSSPFFKCCLVLSIYIFYCSALNGQVWFASVFYASDSVFRHSSANSQFGRRTLIIFVINCSFVYSSSHQS